MDNPVFLVYVLSLGLTVVVVPLPLVIHRERPKTRPTDDHTDQPYYLGQNGFFPGF